MSAQDTMYVLKIAALYQQAPDHSDEERLAEELLHAACKRLGLDPEQLIREVGRRHAELAKIDAHKRERDGQ